MPWRLESIAPRTSLPLAAAVLVAVAAPAAAGGWLVHAEVGSAVDVGVGSNPFTGSGDAVDVGALNAQCSDEEDVVDVGVANDEGNGEPASPATRCDEGGTDCRQEEGGGARVNGHQLVDTEPTPDGEVERPVGGEADERCTDDGDSVDVGVLNVEGNLDDRKCDPFFDPAERGDRGDGVDVGVVNRECNDQEDTVDAGVVNCEFRDPADPVDVGVLNDEVHDHDDGIDVGILNNEAGDDGDGTDVELRPGPPTGFCIAKDPPELP